MVKFCIFKDFCHSDGFEQMDGQTGEQTDEQMDRQTDMLVEIVI